MNYKYLDIITSIFVMTVLVSAIASSAKIVDFGYSIFSLRLAFDAGTLLFPVSYIFGDVLTEVYGYKKAKRVIWIGFLCALVMSIYLLIVSAMPGESNWQEYAGNDAYNSILGGVSSGGIILASLVAYLAGELSNAKVLSKMKIFMQGKHLWMRTIGSTLVGQGIDTVIFVCIASAVGVFPWSIAVSLIVANYIFKVGIEILCTPLTYKAVSFLKSREIKKS